MITRKYRALFIDDRETDRFLNNLMIKEDHIPVIPCFVSSGEEALVFLHECNQEDFPDLIFVDVNMPEMNGFQFVEAYIQQFGMDYPATKIFFLTSSISDSDRPRAISMPNVHGFFNKPLRKRVFDAIFPLLV